MERVDVLVLVDDDVADVVTDVVLDAAVVVVFVRVAFEVADGAADNLCVVEHRALVDESHVLLERVEDAGRDPVDVHSVLAQHAEHLEVQPGVPVAPQGALLAVVGQDVSPDWAL